MRKVLAGMRKKPSLGRKIIYAVSILILVTLFVVKELALLWWLTEPDNIGLQAARISGFNTSSTHIWVSFLMLIVNILFAFIVVKLIEKFRGKKFSETKSAYPWIGGLILLAFIWVSGDEARTLCYLLGWSHTGYAVF